MLNSSIVKLSPDGLSLSYEADSNGNRIPDYSTAGYMGGGVAIPNVAVVEEISPIAGDNTAHIQTAIDRVAARPLNANGFRGALLLRAGTYQISGTLRISADGVVVRGAGAHKSGTIIIHRGTAQAISFSVVGAAPTLSGRLARITQPVVPSGSRSFTVDSVASLQPNQEYVIETFTSPIGIDAMQLADGWLNATKTSLLLDTTARLERKITSINTSTRVVQIEGSTANLLNIGAREHTAEIKRVTTERRRQRIGIEDLILYSTYDKTKRDTARPGNYPNDAAHAWEAISLRDVKNAWVRRVLGFHYGLSLVTVGSKHSQNITVEDTALIDSVATDTLQFHAGFQKYQYNMNGSGLLVQRSYGRYGRHPFITNSCYSTNVVFLDNAWDKGHISSEPHQQLSQAVLFDNVCGDSGFKLNRSRSNDGTTAAPKVGHGQRAIACTMWNLVVQNNPRQVEPDYFLSSGRFGRGPNWAVGLKSNSPPKTAGVPLYKTPGNEYVSDHPSEASYMEALGAEVYPRSLYLTQLRMRLGAAAVEAITTPAQRTDVPQTVSGQLRSKFATIPEYSDPDTFPTWLPSTVWF